MQQFDKNWKHESIIHIKDKQGTVTKSIMLHVDAMELQRSRFPSVIMQEEVDKVLQHEAQMIFNEGAEQQYNLEFKNDFSFKIGVIGMLFAISKGQEATIPAILCDYRIEDHGFVKIK
jgi:hypothetical protein